MTDLETRITAQVLVRRYISGGLTAMTSGKPISDRERKKVLERPITHKEWGVLALDREAGETFDAMMAKIASEAPPSPVTTPSVAT